MNLSIVTKEIFGQNEMNIYQNENNDIFMTREQIGQALEYKNPRRAISDIHNRNKERLDEFSVVSKLRTTDEKSYETIIYNEKGIYEIIRKSGQSKADQFYDWVYNLLSNIRKGNLQVDKPNNTKLLLETALKHEERIETIASSVTNLNSDVTYLKETMRIDGIQEKKLQNKAKAVAIEALGGMNSNAYKNVSRKVFRSIWKDFNNHFELPRYGELPRKQFKNGMRFLGMWQPSTSLRIEIDELNRQIEGVI